MKLLSPVRARTRALVAGVVLASVSAIAIAAAPVGAQTSSSPTPCPSGPPVLSVANPNPGDVLSQGDYIFSGVAFDPAASDGSGVARVDLFIGNRDDGGVLLASAPVSGRQYEVKGTVPSNITGSHDFFAYAVSSVTGQQTSISFPIYLGAPPTPTPSSATAPTPVPMTETRLSTCSAPAAAAPAAAPATSVQAPAPVSATESAPVLSLGNPNAGDVLPLGDTYVNGIAYDPGATSGAGVDRVELFLDSRENGGTVVGIGTPGTDHTFSVKVTLHSNQTGGHTFYAYARSSVTGLETVTSVPVFVGPSPTATPRPTNS